MNQLNWFGDKRIADTAICVYHTVFNTVYRRYRTASSLRWFNLERLDTPAPLPPNCGGIGFPILWEKKPDYLAKYISFIEYVLQLDLSAAFRWIYALKRMNTPIRKGIVPLDMGSIVLDDVARMIPHSGDIVEPNEYSIYSLQQVITYLEGLGINIPKSPYTGDYDRDSVINEANIIGLIPLSRVIDQFDRVSVFNRFLCGDFSPPEQRTLSRYLRDSSRFWKKVFKTFPNLPPPSKDWTFSALEGAVNRKLFGFVLRTRSRSLVLNYGPSLIINDSFQSRSSGKSGMFGRHTPPKESLGQPHRLVTGVFQYPAIPESWNELKKIDWEQYDLLLEDYSPEDGDFSGDIFAHRPYLMVDLQEVDPEDLVFPTDLGQ